MGGISIGNGGGNINLSNCPFCGAQLSVAALPSHINHHLIPEDAESPLYIRDNDRDDTGVIHETIPS